MSSSQGMLCESSVKLRDSADKGLFLNHFIKVVPVVRLEVIQENILENEYLISKADKDLIRRHTALLNVNKSTENHNSQRKDEQSKDHSIQECPRKKCILSGKEHSFRHQISQQITDHSTVNPDVNNNLNSRIPSRGSVENKEEQIGFVEGIPLSLFNGDSELRSHVFNGSKTYYHDNHTSNPGPRRTSLTGDVTRLNSKHKFKSTIIRSGESFNEEHILKSTANSKVRWNNENAREYKRNANGNLKYKATSTNFSDQGGIQYQPSAKHLKLTNNDHASCGCKDDDSKTRYTISNSERQFSEAEDEHLVEHISVSAKRNTSPSHLNESKLTSLNIEKANSKSITARLAHTARMNNCEIRSEPKPSVGITQLREVLTTPQEGSQGKGKIYPLRECYRNGAAISDSKCDNEFDASSDSDEGKLFIHTPSDEETLASTVNHRGDNQLASYGRSWKMPILQPIIMSNHRRHAVTWNTISEYDIEQIHKPKKRFGSEPIVNDTGCSDEDFIPEGYNIPTINTVTCSTVLTKTLESAPVISTQDNNYYKEMNDVQSVLTKLRREISQLDVEAKNIQQKREARLKMILVLDRRMKSLTPNLAETCTNKTIYQFPNCESDSKSNGSDYNGIDLTRRSLTTQDNPANTQLPVLNMARDCIALHTTPSTPAQPLNGALEVPPNITQLSTNNTENQAVNSELTAETYLRENIVQETRAIVLSNQRKFATYRNERTDMPMEQRKTFGVSPDKMQNTTKELFFQNQLRNVIQPIALVAQGSEPKPNANEGLTSRVEYRLMDETNVQSYVDRGTLNAVINSDETPEPPRYPRSRESIVKQITAHSAPFKHNLKFKQPGTKPAHGQLGAEESGFLEKTVTSSQMDYDDMPRHAVTIAPKSQQTIPLEDQHIFSAPNTIAGKEPISITGSRSYKKFTKPQHYQVSIAEPLATHTGCQRGSMLNKEDTKPPDYIISISDPLQTQTYLNSMPNKKQAPDYAQSTNQGPHFQEARHGLQSHVVQLKQLQQSRPLKGKQHSEPIQFQKTRTVLVSSTEIGIQPSIHQGVRTCLTCHNHACCLCSLCKRAWYCSEKCQEEDWEKHRNKCRR